MCFWFIFFKIRGCTKFARDPQNLLVGGPGDSQSPGSMGTSGYDPSRLTGCRKRLSIFCIIAIKVWFLFIIFLKIWYINPRPKWSMVPESPNFICHFLRAIPKGLSFGLCLYVLCWCNVHILYCNTCIQIVQDLNLCKSLRWPCAVDRAISLQ